MTPFFRNVCLPWLCRPWSGGVVLGLLGWLLVLATIDPSGSYPALGEGPGITLDESFNAQQGVLLVEAWRAYGLFLFDPLNAKEIFGGESLPYLPDHPPLGRWILGIAHHLAWSVFEPESPGGPVVTACARTGSALLYGLTICLIGITAGRWLGPVAGWGAAVSVLLMPRLFAHAHIASLETCVGFFYAWAVIGLGQRWSQYSSRLTKKETEKNPEQQTERLNLHWQAGLVPGLLLGLALLTKIQGFLVIPCGVLWGLWYWREKAVLPLLTWGMMGGLVFFLGWPWLWIDPVGHLQQFLGSATDRVSLNVFYAGQVYADHAVPWHYPWVLFLTTVPVLLHLLGFLGLFWQWQKKEGEKQENPAIWLALGAILFPLILFSTSAAVYDGSRLFLMVFPLWGIFIGAGINRSWQWLVSRNTSALQWSLVGLVLLFQGWGLVSTHPCQLAYYNFPLAKGNPSGPQWLEATYWGDSITRSFLQECTKHLPEGAVVEIAPVLHQFQCEEMQKQSPIVQRQGWQFRSFDAQPTETERHLPRERYVLVFYRFADLPEPFRSLSEIPAAETSMTESNSATEENSDSGPVWKPLLSLKRQRTPLAALFRLDVPAETP